MINIFPYTDFHELNLDWILHEIRKLHAEWTEFQVINEISFSGEWDITKNYRAWTIVNANNGQDGFISIKPVPAGIDINNTDYWVGVANYSAVIADLQNRMIRAEHRLDLNDWHTKKVLLIGDSYASGWNPDEGNVTGYVQRFREYMGLSAGTSFFTSTHDGYGFVNANGNFIDLLEAASVPTPGDITDILVLGGINDAFSDPTQLDIAIDTFMEKALELYPGAMVTVGMISGSRDPSIHNALPGVVNHYKRCAHHKNARYMANIEFVLCDKRLMSSDKNHPLDAGYSQLADYLAAYMKNGKIDVIRPREQLNTSARTSMAMFWSQYNDVMSFEISAVLTDLPYNAVYTEQNQNLIPIAGYPFQGTGEVFVTTPCDVAHTVGGSTQYDFYPMQLRITDSYIEYYVRTGAAMTIQNTTKFTFRTGVHTVPAMQF